jgi:cyanophycinase
MIKLAWIIALIYGFSSCGNKELPNPFEPNAPKPTSPSIRPGSLGILGDTTDVQTTTKGGLVIMGGGTDVDAAFKWMIDRSGGGDVVIIRASGTNAYNDYVNRLGKVNSVETLKIDSRKLADDDRVATIIRNAEMLFIAGGDQADYMGYWKSTKVMQAINYLLSEKKVPVGGTSAGAAILGNYYFGAERGGVDSDEALSNPYNTKVVLGRDDFLKAPFMSNVITDQHFAQRSREGRLTVFLSRIMKDWVKAANAIAVDERTAVCIDELGNAEVLGSNNAYFVKTDITKQPESVDNGIPLSWDHSGKAIKVFSVSGTVNNNKFNMNTFQPQTPSLFTSFWWSVVAGSWKVVQ